MVKLITSMLFTKVAEEAQESPRKRKNYNLHKHEEKVQRLLNVLQLGTYVTPHKHEGTEAFELFSVLQGQAGVLIFNEDGEIQEKVKLEAGGPVIGLEIPGETYHTVFALVPNTVLLEVKEGPYRFDSAKQFLPGFPQEIQALEQGPSSKAAKQISALLKEWSQLFAIKS